MDTEAQGWWGPRNFDGFNLLRCARVAIVWLLLLTLSACSESVVTAQHDAGVEEFFQHAQSDKDHVWLEEKASEFIATLPRDTRIAIAERALLHTDPFIQVYGVNQFYESGLTERGDAAAADLVVQGVDLTGMTWAWLHSADSKLLEKRLAGIS